jgi:hypothetical protein
MIGFIGTSLQLQSIIRAHTLNSFLTTSIWRISMKNLSLLSECRTGYYSLELSLILQPMVSRPVCLGIKHPSGAYDQILFSLWQLRVCWCWALSLTRGRVCRLQLLLGLASAVSLWSESRGTRDHILLSQIRDFNFFASYDSQGYGIGIRPRLHTGCSPSLSLTLSNSRIHCLSQLPRGRDRSHHILNFLSSAMLSRECLC